MSTTLRLTRAAFGAVQRASPRLAALWAERIFCTPPRRPISERMAVWLREAQRSTVRVGARDKARPRDPSRRVPRAVGQREQLQRAIRSAAGRPRPGHGVDAWPAGAAAGLLLEGPQHSRIRTRDACAAARDPRSGRSRGWLE